MIIKILTLTAALSPIIEFPAFFIFFQQNWQIVQVFQGFFHPKAPYTACILALLTTLHSSAAMVHIFLFFAATIISQNSMNQWLKTRNSE